jgi:peptidoglycan hydrolase-like protein with peptidoglycan-binding domain
MQFEISDRAAIVFAEELYTNLISRRDPIDASVAEARKAIYSDVDKVEWATPVLFVRDPDSELFRWGRAHRETAGAPKDVVTPEVVVEPPPVEKPPKPPRPWWRRLVALLAPGIVLLGAILLIVRACSGDGGGGTATTTTTAASAALGFPTIQVGDEGATVAALQHLLNVKGETVPVTGFFDDTTFDAVERVEQATNIPVDGVVGRVTWQQLAAPIRRGDSGEAVLAAEELLQLAGFDIKPDDRFTNGTQDLVLQLQKRHGLAADGIVEVDTWRVLLALAAKAPAPPVGATTFVPATTIAATPTTAAAPATSVAPPPPSPPST